MTRLRKEDIDSIAEQIENYDQLFYRQTGYTMEAIACKAVNLKPPIHKKKAAVITITSGQGVIGEFAQSIAAILKHCKISAEVMGKTDVAGLQQAYTSGAEIVILADDDAFVALGIGSAVHSDNGKATGRGYAAALLAAMEKQGITATGQEILIIGAGPVGAAAARYVAENHATPIICDLQEQKAKSLAEQIVGARTAICPLKQEAYPYIIEASTAADVIHRKDVTAQSIISAPGVPCGVSGSARDIATVIYNPLELGVLVMYFECMVNWECGVSRKGQEKI